MGEVKKYVCDCGCGQESESLDGWLLLVKMILVQYNSPKELNVEDKLIFAGQGCLIRWISERLNGGDKSEPEKLVAAGNNSPFTGKVG